MIKSLVVTLVMLLFIGGCNNANLPKDEQILDDGKQEVSSTTDLSMEKQELTNNEKEIEITENIILKYYNYFVKKQGLFCIDKTFDNTNELSDNDLITFAIVNLIDEDTKMDSDGYSYWDRVSVENEIERGLNRKLNDVNVEEGIVQYISGTDIFRSIGFSLDSGFEVKVVSLKENIDGTMTGVFDLYSVFDCVLNNGTFDVKKEILKDYSEILNSEMCPKVRKTIVFLERYDESSRMYLEFISIK